MEKITNDMYVNWKRHDVTIAIMEALQDRVDTIKATLTNGDMIVKDREECIRLVGYKEGIEELLNISAEGIIDSEEA